MTGKGGYIYIVSNKTRTVLYIGVTSDLANRVFQHKEGKGSQFTSKYNCKDLLYYEFFDSIDEAILREKRFLINFSLPSTSSGQALKFSGMT
tara:strand:- start:2147 stop:2422 length:276 start_codon:yes stop_codon:yes gene_type:complete